MCPGPRGNQEWRLETVPLPAGRESDNAIGIGSPVRIMLVKTNDCLDSEEQSGGLMLRQCSPERAGWQTWLVQELRLEDFEMAKKKAMIIRK
ncbi:unnamed protein product [Protopolystoma xenopodis]|uniref:Uncharacterized protein n=1 Tax=Protopolystoma xenopodis TaxID=117903 RepID=A0A3S5CMS3_9PLAT|nr:unnamed protein product [Protopolystoma xenopodis]